MDVKMTQALEAFMLAEQLDPGELIRAFSEWKSSRDEYSSYLFGKDAAYAKPSVFGIAHAFRHVHLVPMKDTGQLAAWNQAWNEGEGKPATERWFTWTRARNDFC